MSTQTASKESVAIRYLDYVTWAYIAHSHNAGYTFGPVLYILYRIGAYYRFTCGTRRGVNTHNLIHGYGIQTEGIFVAQVVFGGKGQFCNVFERLDIFRFQAHFIKFLPVEGHLLITGLYGIFQSLSL